MKTIKEKNITEIEIKNSKFITLLYPCETNVDIKNILDNVKDEYKNANHYCYAYITSNLEKAYDDGEPTGTAGMPILNVLKKKKMSNIMCIVVRYFGGIKLGSGGLIRAYSKAVSNGLKASELITIKKSLEFIIEFAYECVETVNFLLKNSIILNKKFNETVIYTVQIYQDEFELINEQLSKYVNFNKI